MRNCPGRKAGKPNHRPFLRHGQHPPPGLGATGIGRRCGTGAHPLRRHNPGSERPLNDLLGGRVAGAFADVPAVLAHVRAGRLKAPGIAAAKRHPALPEVRTFQAQGFANVDTNNELVGTRCSFPPRRRLIAG
ncbi:hypothetical protein D5045_04135 [Verminephrobacter eiseniae]|nr:hypothetical protein [Verminephrobacter eiseniae]